MKFLIDAQLPPSLAGLLVNAGHEAIHTRELPAGNVTRDGALNEISLRERCVVVSKDTDFFYSHVLQGRPWKLVLVRTGNLSAAMLKGLFLKHLEAIVAALQTHTLVELDRATVTAVI